MSATSLHFFWIPVQHPQPAQDQLNAFLKQVQLLQIERCLVSDGTASGWSVCVECLAEGLSPKREAQRAQQRERIDYKLYFDDADFGRYCRLRDWRKTIAESEGLPLFAVLSNAQMAMIVEQKIQSKTALAAVDGIGQGKLQRYGSSLLALIDHLWEAGDGEDATH